VPSRAYKGPKGGNRIDGSESIGPWVRRIAELQTYPALRRRNAISLDADPVELHFYSELVRGRECSCIGRSENPSSACPTCFGVGIVGGYNKYGTTQVVVDPTLPNSASSGIKIAVPPEGPEAWVLEDNALFGVLEATIHFEGHCGPVDHLGLLGYEGGEGGSVGWSIRPLGRNEFCCNELSPIEVSGNWLPLTAQTLQELTTKPQLLRVRLQLSRTGTAAKSPVGVRALLRIKREPSSETVIRANRPQITRAIALAELGQLDEWTTANYWTDHKLPLITSRDWLYDLDSRERWKIVDAKDLAPQNYLLSWDLTCRRVQDFEPIYRYPI
jgi:hypothetical protein